MIKISRAELTIARSSPALAIAHNHASPTAERTTPSVLQRVRGQRLPWRQRNRPGRLRPPGEDHDRFAC